MASTERRARGWIGRIVRRLGGAEAGGGTPNGTGASHRQDPVGEAAALIHRELNAIRPLAGRSPVAIEPSADPLWLEVGLKEHLEVARDDGGTDEGDGLAARIGGSSRWNLTRFREDHAAVTEELAAFLREREDELPEAVAERLAELLRSCRDLDRELRGSWLQTEFELGADDPAEKAARSEVGEGVLAVRELALAAAEAILDG